MEDIDNTPPPETHTTGYRNENWKTDDAELESALDAFWNVAYTQGHEQRGHDDEAGTAQKADDELRRVIASRAAPAPQNHLRGDGEAAVIECLAAGQNFVFDPSTNFLHADDGTAQGIRYIAEHGDMPHMPWPASEWAIDRISKLEAALKKVADMLDAEDADLDDAISIASAALAATTEGK